MSRTRGHGTKFKDSCQWVSSMNAHSSINLYRTWGLGSGSTTFPATFRSLSPCSGRVYCFLWVVPALGVGEGGEAECIRTDDVFRESQANRDDNGRLKGRASLHTSPCCVLVGCMGYHGWHVVTPVSPKPGHMDQYLLEFDLSPLIGWFFEF